MMLRLQFLYVIFHQVVVFNTYMQVAYNAGLLFACDQGYGILMLEKHVVQPDGTLLTRGSDTYKIPSMGNIPQSFNVSLLQDSGNTRAFYSSEVSFRHVLGIFCKHLLSSWLLSKYPVISQGLML